MASLPRSAPGGALREAAPGGALAFRGLTLGYARHPAVHHLDGTLRPGSLTAVVGPNGAGKSTLLKGIMGEIRPLEGEVVRSGLSRHDIAYLPQAAEIDRAFPIGVFDLVAMGLWRRVGPWRSLGRHRGAVEAALAAVGLTGFERRPIGTLSGGQLRRALFARVLLQDARVILLDEPFAAIDARTTDELLALVHGWHGEGRTVVAVLHDLDQVGRHFPETLLLAREAVAWGATATVLTPENLRRARRLCEAWDEEAPVCRAPAAAQPHAHGPQDHGSQDRGSQDYGSHDNGPHGRHSHGHAA
ncbi:zinc/manganese transport system ATP-binding protein [Methylobacterium sp. ap11]|uniref:zinc ABC transporter ATP-binding protein AztA n=1 Tax=Methylobacterium sp. ap11 TaxID=1761799 RepID=UPI0008CE2462|nr:zinc ABC transporter ATP-binding protein AztA [Methylobacterium sp. ap11]SEP47577.1 zinc/manganese transport system ATP-binding protein [Methylobacterium sp. ap11]